MEQISALVISGALGSGKTTLVRHLLEDARTAGQRVAFISNELGALGIDQALLQTHSGQEAFVELAGGCVCCALSDALYDTLLRLRDEIQPDRIIIETSGAAIPHDVQITLYQPPLRDWITEEAVVTVVCAEQLREKRDLVGTFSEQVECADLLLLHKVDLLASPDEIPSLTAVLQQLNPGTPVVAATHGRVDPRLLLGALTTQRPLPEAHPPHTHAPLSVAVLPVPPGQTADALEAWALSLGALRVKGIVVGADGGLWVVQGVGRRCEVVPLSRIAPGARPQDADLIGRVVVIRRADVQELGGPPPLPLEMP